MKTKIIKRAYKFRIYPTLEQISFFAKSFGCVRKVHNLMLDDRKKAYEEYKSTGIKTKYPTPAKYKEEYPYLKEVDSLALANTQLNLEKAYKNFLKNKDFGFPKYKCKSNPVQSYTTNNQNTIYIKDSYIKLPKLKSLVKIRLHREIKGDFFWDEKVIPTKKRQKISYMVMQDVNYELFAESVEEECSFGINRPDPRVIAETMDTLDLLPLAKQHPGTLSGGQKQRVAVAVGQVCKKEIIVFDEPTSGLDYESMIRVARIVQSLSEQGKIIFVVTHDFEFFCKTCNRVLVLSDGEISCDLKCRVDNKEQIKQMFFSAIGEKKR